MIGNILLKKRIWHPSVQILIGSSIAIGGGILGSSMLDRTQWSAFEMLFCICYGFGNGFTYMTPFYIPWLYFPDKRVMITGYINAFFGLGAGIFTFTAAKYCNPTGVNPDPVANNGKPFSYEVGQNFPVALRKLSYWYIGLLVMTVLTMPTYPKKDENDEPAKVEEDDAVPDLRLSLNTSGEAARESRVFVSPPDQVAR